MSDTETMPKAVLVLRPFGYLLVTLVYVVLLAVVLVLGWGGLFIGLDRGFGAGTDAGGAVGFLLVVVLIGPVLGGALGIATALTASSVMLGGLALTRSLMPRHADLPLTHTVRSDDAVGPPRLTKGAISLLPTQRGRFAELALRLNLAAQGLSWRVLLALAWLGVADMVTAGWVRWPVTGGWRVVWTAISVGLVILGVAGLVHAVRHGSRRAPGRPARRPLGSGRLP